MSLQYDRPMSPHSVEGEKHAQTALIFGILAVTVFPLVFAPLALAYVKKAEEHRVSATAGKVLGWVGVGFAVLGILYVVLLILFFAASATSGEFSVGP